MGCEGGLLTLGHVSESDAYTEGQGRLDGPSEKQQPLPGRRDPELTGDGNQGAPVSHISRTVSRHPLPWVPLPMCYDKTLPPSTRHSRWILGTMSASLPLLLCFHTTHLCFEDLQPGIRAEAWQGLPGACPGICGAAVSGVLTVSSPLPSTLRACPTFLSTFRAAGGWE